MTRKKILRCAVGIILLLYSAVIGCYGLKGGTMVVIIEAVISIIAVVVLKKAQSKK